MKCGRLFLSIFFLVSGVSISASAWVTEKFLYPDITIPLGNDLYLGIAVNVESQIRPIMHQGKITNLEAQHLKDLHNDDPSRPNLESDRRTTPCLVFAKEGAKTAKIAQSEIKFMVPVPQEVAVALGTPELSFVSVDMNLNFDFAFQAVEYKTATAGFDENLKPIQINFPPAPKWQSNNYSSLGKEASSLASVASLSCQQ